MKLQTSIDRRDRRLLSVVGVCALCATVLIAIVHPEQEQDTFIPSTYSSAPHGAKAALLLLRQLGYGSEQSDRPLEEVAAAAGTHTVLILAEPARAPNAQETAAVRRVLEHGGRVLAAGFLSAAAIPDENLDSQSPPQLLRGICEAQPIGFSPLTRGGKLVMRDVRFVWRMDRPAQRVVYACGGAGVVVSYPVGNGTAVWWASASPLENRDIAAPGSLDLLLNSLALQPGDHVIWDESLHAAPPAAWDFRRDRTVRALGLQLLLLALLLLLARARRSGPLRPMPLPARSSPLEFVRALGGLYRSSGAHDVPVTIAYERFCSQLAHHYGVASAQTATPDALTDVIQRRFGIDSPTLRDDLEACASVGRLTDLNARQALVLVQALSRYTEQLAQQRDRQRPSTTENNRGFLGTRYAAPEHTRPNARAAQFTGRSA
jgi:Domain of unknown function (DUF4350)